MPLWPGVSLTLLGEDRGWQFVSWTTFAGAQIPPPPEDEGVKWFATAEDAAAHFRALCPRDPID